MVLTNSPAGSIHQAELAFSDPVVTGTIASGAGMVLPDGRKVAFTTKDKGHEDTPDEDRVNRSAKKGRVVAVEQMQPPKDFSAGSILQRTRLLFQPTFNLKDKSAFVKPKIRGKEIQIATNFYKKSRRSRRGRLADAGRHRHQQQGRCAGHRLCARSPDYARQSPFDSILTDKADDGRFVPQIGPKDHAWAASVLPPSVFSADEQQCLASGIYFEARGETVKGQAAVAQVILNRVRNPSLSEDHLRRRLPERGLAQSLPVLLRLRQHQGPGELAGSLENRPRSGDGGDGWQDLAAPGRLCDPLPRRLCPSEMGENHGKGRPHRSARLLPHLWRRLELTKTPILGRFRPDIGAPSGRILSVDFDAGAHIDLSICF
jgi:hypothetical protein